MSALLAASRPTRRDMARHPLRILAAVLLITLPLFIASWTLTEGHSEHTASLQDQGRTTATWQGGSCVQSVNGSDADCTSPPAGDDPRVPEILRDSLPAGFTAELHVHAWGAVSHGERHATLSLQQHPGKRTPAPGEVWLNTATARDLHVETGDTVTFTPRGTGEPVELTVAGTMPGFTSLVGAPGLMDPDAFHLSEGLYPTWSITGPEEFTWDDVLALNAVGFTVVSRDVIDNPPPPEAVAEQFRGDPLDHGERVTSVDDWSIRLITLAGILTVGLLAMLVISPVFTIATSRMARIFALMSAQGATPWHIRLAVLTYGFVAGLIGATVGVALGVGAAAVQWFLRFPDWPFTVPWGSLLLMWAVAVGGSTAASLLPAWVASRASISAGVQGASPDRLLRWRPWMAVGPVGLALLTVGMLVLWVTTAPGTRYYWSTLPALALVVLLAASAPALVWGLGRLGRNAPLALRIACRPASRWRSTPTRRPRSPATVPSSTPSTRGSRCSSPLRPPPGWLRTPRRWMRWWPWCRRRRGRRNASTCVAPGISRRTPGTMRSTTTWTTSAGSARITCPAPWSRRSPRCSRPRPRCSACCVSTMLTATAPSPP